MVSTSEEAISRDGTFVVFVPGVFEVLEKSEEDVEATRPIGGWCSTEELDRQGEIVVAKGLDFTEFVKWGWFNDNHKQDTSAALGFPRLARLEKGRWWTEGNLIAGYPPADQIWNLAKSLQKAGSSRRLGFSIEGKVVERDGHNKILRAIIRDVAVTRSPVNTSCSWGILAKSFAGPDEVLKAADRAENHSRSSNTEIVRDSSFSETLSQVKRRWPQISDAVAQRAARHALRVAQGAR